MIYCYFSHYNVVESLKHRLSMLEACKTRAVYSKGDGLIWIGVFCVHKPDLLMLDQRVDNARSENDNLHVVSSSEQDARIHVLAW